MCFHFKKKKVLCLLLLSIIYLSSCHFKNQEKSDDYKVPDNSVSQNYNNNKIYDINFINEFKEIIKDDVTIPDSFINSIDILSTLADNKNSEAQYRILSNLIDTLPKPFIDSAYKVKYEVVVNHLKELYTETAKAVPKIFHFIWLGGPLGNMQKEYIKIWATINPDYEFNVWYDSKNMFTYETQKSMKEYIELSLFQYKNSNNYEKIFADKFIELQDQLFNYYDTELKKNNSFTKDSIRVDFIDKVLYKKPSEKIAESKYKENLSKMDNDIIMLQSEHSNIKFKNVNTDIENWKLKEFYDHELDLRGNFAASSDILRLILIARYGGVYADVDLLPTMSPIYEFIAKHPELESSIALPYKILKLAFLEEVIHKHKNILPSYQDQDNRYIRSLRQKINLINQSKLIDDEFKGKIKNLDEKIINLAKDPKYSDLKNLFFNLSDVLVREGEFKIIRGNNSFISSHPVKNKNDWIQQLTDTVHDKYLQVFNLEKNNPGLKLPHKNLENISKGTADYYRYDGLLIDSDTTISISGPCVYNDILSKVSKINPAASYSYFNKLVNSFTPESEVSSWFKRSGAKDWGRKNIIIQLGNEQNTKIAAENIFNKFKENAGLYSVSNDEFQKMLEDEEYDDFFGNNNERTKIDLHIVGHTEIISNDNISIGGLNPELLATKINQHLFNEINHKRLEYISIVSCNPTGDPNNTQLLESYSKKLLNKLNEYGISVQVASIRTTNVRVDKNGEKYYLHGDTYTGHREGDKFYVLRKNSNDFLTIKALYLPEQITSKFIVDVKSYLSSLKIDLKEIVEEGASGPLGEMPKIVENLQNSYSIKKLTNSLAEKAKVSTSSIRSKQNMNSKFAPLFPSLNLEKQTISFLNTETGEMKKDIILSEHELQNFKEIWENLISEMKKLKAIPLSTDESGVIKSLGEAEGLGITPLLVAQTLYSAFKANSSSELSNTFFDPALGKMIQIQSYLFYTQLGVDIFNKVNQLENIVTALIQTKIITEEENIFPNVNQVIAKLTAAKYIGSSFAFANVALDAFEYSYANGIQKSLFATQLSFDSLNASMTFTSLALGEGVASSVIGYLGTPLAGLAIGFTGFATAAIEAQEESFQIAKFFNEYQKDHRRVGNISICSPNLNVISLAHSNYTKSKDNICTANLNSAVIKTVDLSSENNMKLTFGSHSMYKTKNWNKALLSGYYSNFQGSSRFPEADKTNSFNIRESLNILPNMNVPITNDTVIIMPFLMEKIISYNYSYTPGIMTRHGEELSTINSISSNKNSQFIFRYFVDLFEYAIRRLSFETKNTDIKVILGSKSRTLITPSIPAEYKSKVNYNIEGGNGKYTLVLEKNAIYNINSKKYDEWTLDVSSLMLEMQFLEKGKFKIGEYTKILFTDKNQIEITIKEAKRIYKLNSLTGKMTNLLEIEDKLNNHTKLLEQLKNTAASLHKHEGMVKINKHLMNGIYKVAWFDFNRNEIIYPYIENEKYFNYDQTSFLGRNNNIAYYFDARSKIIFQQDLFITNGPNTTPLAKVSENTEPYYNSHDGLLIYKNSESSIPGVHGDWDYTIARDVSGRHLLQIDIKNNARAKMNTNLIEALLRVQRTFNMKQPVKISDKSNDLVGWFIKQNNEIPKGKFIIASSKTKDEISNPEYAGYMKKKNGNIQFFFTGRDQNTARISLFKQDEMTQKNERVIIRGKSNIPQQILSVSIVGNKPVILTDNRFMYSFDDEGEISLVGINFSLSNDVTEDLNSVIKNIISSHINHSNIISIIDANGGYAWYNFKEDVFVSFHPKKKFIGKDDQKNYFFIDENTKRVYYKTLESGNLKNYSLSLENNKVSFKTIAKSEELELAKNYSTQFKLMNESDDNIEPSIINNEKLNIENQIIYQSYKDNEQVESQIAKTRYEDIINKSSFNVEQEKLDADIPQGGTARRSIIFVNDGWYNSAVEIFIEDSEGNSKKFHSWWGQKSNFTVTPLVPIDTKNISISIQSYFLGWSKPFYTNNFKLSDLPLCINSTGTLFYRNTTVRNCNQKH